MHSGLCPSFPSPGKRTELYQDCQWSHLMLWHQGLYPQRRQDLRAREVLLHYKTRSLNASGRMRNAKLRVSMQFNNTILSFIQFCHWVQCAVTMTNCFKTRKIKKKCTMFQPIFLSHRSSNEYSTVVVAK